MSWDRVIAPAATISIPVALILMLYGQGYVALGVAAVIIGLSGLARRPQRRRHVDVDWTATSALAAPRSAPSRGSVVVALAPVEARELVLSPWFGAGAGFCVLFGSISITSFERSWWLSAALLPLMVHPLCGMTIIATHRNVTRAHRDGAQELFDACPASVAQRTGAHLFTAVVPVVVATVFVMVTLLGAAVALEHIYGPVDDRVLADAALAGLLLPAGATALGLLLGRRVRFALAPFVALAVIALLNLEMWDRGLDGRGWLATGIPSGKIDFIYLEPPVAGRLLWIAGLAVLVGGFGLAAADRSATTKLIVSFGAVIALVGLVLTVRPLPDDIVVRLTDYVLSPQNYEDCHAVTGDVEVCVLQPYRDHGANVADHLGPVAAAIPDGVVEVPITMRLLVGEGIVELPSQVQDRIVPTAVPPGTVALPFSHNEGSLDEASFILAVTAVGLPMGDDAPENLLVDGQARGLVVLWLATSGLTHDAALDLLRPDEFNDNTPAGDGHVWPGTCTATVQWAPQDLVAARALVGVDHDGVTDLLAGDWQHWTNPDTSTDDLMVALGLPLVGPSDPIEPLGSTC